MPARGAGVNEQQELTLKFFEPATIKPDSTCIFIGKRNSGKSKLLADILYHKRKEIPTAIVFSQTESTNPFYIKMLPDAFIYDGIDKEALQRILMRQKVVVKQPPPTENFNPTLLVIFDDCMPEKKSFNDPLIRFLFLNGRHLKIFLMVILQYANDLPKALRANCDYIFCLKENQPNVREVLRSTFFSGFNRQGFDQVMSYYTDNYGCLVVNGVERSQEMTKQYFWYRAKPDHGVWRLDYGDMYKFEKEHYTGGIVEEVQVDWSLGNQALSAISRKAATATANDSKGTRIKHAVATGVPSAANVRQRPYVLHKEDEHGNLIDTE